MITLSPKCSQKWKFRCQKQKTVPTNNFWGFHFTEQKRKNVDFTALFEVCQTFIHFPKTDISKTTIFRDKPHYHFRGKPRYHSVVHQELNKIAVLFKKTAACKASGVKKDLARMFLARSFCYALCIEFCWWALPKNKSAQIISCP